MRLGHLLGQILPIVQNASAASNTRRLTGFPHVRVNARRGLVLRGRRRSLAFENCLHRLSAVGSRRRRRRRRSRRPARISSAFRRRARACSLGARPTRAAVRSFSQSVRGRVFLFIAYDTGRHGFGACAVGDTRDVGAAGSLQTVTARLELLDGGADGSPKSWRALADDLRRDGLL